MLTTDENPDLMPNPNSSRFSLRRHWTRRTVSSLAETSCCGVSRAVATLHPRCDFADVHRSLDGLARIAYVVGETPTYRIGRGRPRYARTHCPDPALALERRPGQRPAIGPRLERVGVYDVRAAAEAQEGR